MIEKDIIRYLKQELDVHVSAVKPTDTSIDEYVLVEKTGSSRENYINKATIAVQSYSNTLQGAGELNELVKDAMIGDGTSSFGIVASSSISKCSLNTDYNFTDTSKRQYRYQAIFDLVY